MTKGIWIIWSNRGGELDRRFVPAGQNELAVLTDMLNGAGELRDGDTIRVVDGESEL